MRSPKPKTKYKIFQMAKQVGNSLRATKSMSPSNFSRKYRRNLLTEFFAITDCPSPSSHLLLLSRRSILFSSTLASSAERIRCCSWPLTMANSIRDPNTKKKFTIMYVSPNFRSAIPGNLGTML